MSTCNISTIKIPRRILSKCVLGHHVNTALINTHEYYKQKNGNDLENGYVIVDEDMLKKDTRNKWNNKSDLLESLKDIFGAIYHRPYESMRLYVLTDGFCVAYGNHCKKHHKIQKSNILLPIFNSDLLTRRFADVYIVDKPLLLRDNDSVIGTLQAICSDWRGFPVSGIPVPVDTRTDECANVTNPNHNILTQWESICDSTHRQNRDIVTHTNHPVWVEYNLCSRTCNPKHKLNWQVGDLRLDTQDVHSIYTPYEESAENVSKKTIDPRMHSIIVYTDGICTEDQYGAAAPQSLTLCIPFHQIKQICKHLTNKSQAMEYNTPTDFSINGNGLSVRIEMGDSTSQSRMIHTSVMIQKSGLSGIIPKRFNATMTRKPFGVMLYEHVPSVYVHGLRTLAHQVSTCVKWTVNVNNTTDMCPIYYNKKCAYKLIRAMGLQTARTIPHQLKDIFNELGIMYTVDTNPDENAVTGNVGECKYSAFPLPMQCVVPSVVAQPICSFLMEHNMNQKDIPATLLGAYACLRSMEHATFSHSMPILLDSIHCPRSCVWAKQIQAVVQKKTVPQLSVHWDTHNICIQVVKHAMGNGVVFRVWKNTGWHVFAIGGRPSNSLFIACHNDRLRNRHNREDEDDCEMPLDLVNAIDQSNNTMSAAALRLAYINAVCMAFPQHLGDKVHTLRAVWLNSEERRRRQQLTNASDNKHITYTQYISDMCTLKQLADLGTGVNYWATIPFFTT